MTNMIYGKTLSINWSLWEEGGMQIDEESKKYLKETMGMEMLSTEIGLEALSELRRQTEELWNGYSDPIKSTDQLLGN